MACFLAAGLYKIDWRYASVNDLLSLLFTVAAAFALFTIAHMTIHAPGHIAPSVIMIAFLLSCKLAVAKRLVSRWPYIRDYWQKSRSWSRGTNTGVPVLLVGTSDSNDAYLRALERDEDGLHKPVGILSIDGAVAGQCIRGVKVLGAVSQFEDVVALLHSAGQKPRKIIFTSKLAELGRDHAERLIDRAEALGLTTSRVSISTELRRPDVRGGLELQPIQVADLLERSQAVLDIEPVRQLIAGRRVLVTGAGGSIGTELSKQIAALAPSEMVLVENSEYNLYNVDHQLSSKFGSVKHFSYLCDVRNIERLDDIFRRHAPELVFHAAALKHVPMVEANAGEGVRTNVKGTIAVADAAKRYGALAMVQVSTDKVVNSYSVMGATKRLAELYCQAADLERDGTRYITVRFGNVLGSSGSVVPLFEKQLAEGGPLTVTDPKMTRFFMTIGEAVALTLQ
ncbi:MAG: polysaccharide biosynthesis protein, partial [Alphaproteobacteria bacterium]|nr:polysaccharide biosynthesis protein [Alphaproteobacteria bacterium]